MTGVEHRRVQTCRRCGNNFCWVPYLGLCPYCDMSKDLRQASLASGDKARPCPDDCCPTPKDQT